jgi:hypothetical protein
MKLIGGALVALAISFIVADIFFPLEPFGIKKPISPVVYAKKWGSASRIS